MKRPIQREFERRAAAAPGATAVVGPGGRLSYGELDSESNRLARLLLAGGCRPGDRVALLMQKRPAAIVAMLAALKAGAIYVPLDPAEPPARLARMLESADCRLLLAAGPGPGALGETLELIRSDARPRLGWLGDGAGPGGGLEPAFAARDARDYASTPPPAAGDPPAVAQILFTSGSTGTPKGVMITHAGVRAFLRWAAGRFGLAADDRVAQHAPLRFDLSTFDVFGALHAGAELHLVPPELNLSPHGLVQFMRESRITHWLAVPSTLNLLARFDAVGQGDLPALRRLLFAGEPMPTPTLIHWMRRLPHARFTNLYGPTETTIASSHHTLPRCPEDPLEPVPIGRPCDGEEILVLDARLRPVPPGETGDIYIRGVGLSPGYWRDPEATARAFLEHPGGRLYRTGDLGWRGEDGLLRFVGRADSQVKCRGYRIELGEVERALLSLPGLAAAAVVALPAPGLEGSRICCAWVPAGGARPTPLRLRSGLARLLPSYMLPVRWRRYASLPLNANGKCDRLKLLEDFRRRESDEGAGGRPPARRSGRSRSPWKRPARKRNSPARGQGADID